MNDELKKANFDFDYIGSKRSEKDAIESGFKQLTGEELSERIVNKVFYGDYPMGFKFIAKIYENSKAEGLNHLGSHDLADWQIDMEKHSFSLHWQNAWMDTSTHAYDVNGTIEFYDVDTGNWRTTFRA